MKDKYKAILLNGKQIREKDYDEKFFTEEQVVSLNSYYEKISNVKNIDDKYYLIVKLNKNTVRSISIKYAVPQSIQLRDYGVFKIQKLEIEKRSNQFNLIRDYSFDSVKFVKHHKDVITPKREKGNAGFDFWAFVEDGETISIEPGDTVMIPTNISVIMPKGFYLHMAERGSTGTKGIKYSCGVIDNNYRGKIFIPITNANKNKTIKISNSFEDVNITDTEIQYPANKAIAQGIPRRYYEDMGIEEITEEDYERIVKKEEFEAQKTNSYYRGEGALGSTNK